MWEVHVEFHKKLGQNVESFLDRYSKNENNEFLLSTGQGWNYVVHKGPPPPQNFIKSL